MIGATLSLDVRRSPVRALEIGVVAGVLLGLLILLVVVGGSMKGVVVLAGFGCLPVLLIGFGSMTRAFQALLILSQSMSLDIYLGYSNAFVETRPGVPVTLTGMLVVCLFAISLFDGRLRGAPARPRAAATRPFVLLVAWAALSVLAASRPNYVLQALPGYLTGLLLYLYALRLMTTEEGVRFTVRWMAVAILASGALALVQCATGGSPNLQLLGGSEEPIVQAYQGAQISRVSGLLRHPNTFAVLLNGFLPLLLVMAGSLTERPLRLLCGAAFGLGTLALVLTYSRGGWVSFALSLALIGLAVPKKHWRPGFGTVLFGIGAIALVAVLLAATPLYSRVMTRVEQDDQGAARSRMALARESLDLIRQRPITGWGLGNYQFASPVVTDDRGVPLIEAGDGRPMRVHNLFLFAAVEIGLPGALLLAGVVVLFLVKAVSITRHAAWLPSRAALGLTCGLVAILTHCMLEPATLADSSYLILPFVGGLVTGLGAWAPTHV